MSAALPPEPLALGAPPRRAGASGPLPSGSGERHPRTRAGTAADLQGTPVLSLAAPSSSRARQCLCSEIQGNAEKCASRNFTTLAFLRSGKTFYKLLGVLARNLHRNRLGLFWRFHRHRLGDRQPPHAPLGIVNDEQ